MENERFETVEDLINSDQFGDWVYHQKKEGFWQDWQADSPERQAMIVQAKQFLLDISFQKKNINVEEMDTALTNVWATINQTSTSKTEGQSTRHLPIRLLRIAAAILFLVISGWLLSNYFTNPYQVYATNYGETETILLPDNSQVVLQANSELKVPKKWIATSDRKVWLEGEAYFSVTKSQMPVPTKFEVHTNDFTVEVLGTQFDVLHRSKHQRVVLQEGKVRLKWEDAKTMDLAPNEMVQFSTVSKKYEKTPVNAAIYTAWTEQKLILNKTPLSEITRIFEENYGYEVQIAPTVDKTQTRTTIGAIELKDLNSLITLIEASYGIEIQQQDKLILIE